MATEQKKKAWGTTAKSEPRWPASLAVLFAATLNYALPKEYALGPGWLVPALVLVILIPLTIAAPRRVPDELRWHQFAAVALIAIVSVANFAALGLLIHQLVTNGKSVTGGHLLISGVAIWMTNIIVFGLWFWEVDRGGPDERLRRDHGAPDFLFPQMISPGCTRPDWSPQFIDYLYVAFTNGTAFSPTDTLPLTPWAKVLMGAESAASLATIAIVAGRAVNILG